MTDGWIMIHRKIIDWQWFKDSNVFYLFLNLLLRANITDSKEGLETIRRGEIKTTIPKLSEYTGLTVSQIRTCIDKLKLSGEIAVRIANKYRVITICNFDTYQCEEIDQSQTVSQTNRRQIADKSQTKQEEKEVSPCTPLQDKEENKEESKKKRKKQSIDCLKSRIKGLSLEEKQQMLYNDIARFVGKYSPDLLRHFYNYWAQPNEFGEMRMEQCKNWETGMRLVNYSPTKYSYNQPTNQPQQHANTQQIQY